MKKPMHAAELKKHRKRLGLTQAQLAAAFVIPVTKNWIHLIEADKYGKVLDGYRADELRGMK